MIQKRTFIGTLLIAGCIPLVASAQNGSGQSGSGQSGSGQTGTPQSGSPQTGTTGQAPRAGQTGSQANPMAGEHGRLALQRSDKILGADVLDSSGGKIGRIDDLLLQPDGTIGYAIISGNDATTMAKEFPIPWKLVRTDMAGNAERSAEPMAGADRGVMNDRYTLTVDSKRLASAPSFDRTQWPKAADAGIYSESDRFFGSSAVAGTPESPASRPVEAGASTPTYFRASQMRNQAVNDPTGMPIGTLGQLVIDPVQGRVNYATFSTTSTAGSIGRSVALPWQTIRASQRDEKDRFELTVPQDRLQGAPEFKNGDENWKHMSDPNYVRDVYGYYSVRPYWNDNGADQGGKPAPNGKDGGDAKKGTEPNPRQTSGGIDDGKDKGGQRGRNDPPHQG